MFFIFLLPPLPILIMVFEAYRRIEANFDDGLLFIDYGEEDLFCKCFGLFFKR